MVRERQRTGLIIRVDDPSGTSLTHTGNKVRLSAVRVECPFLPVRSHSARRELTRSGIIGQTHQSSTLGLRMTKALPVRGLFLILLLLELIGALVSVPAGADTGRPNAELGPTHVQVGIFLLDLDAIDSASQSFQANVYFEATWKDPRLEGEAQGLTVTRRSEEVWHPRLQILNQQRIWSSLPDVVDIEPDGTVTYRARVWGDFSQPLDLREFPFDSQRIEIPVVAAGFSPEEVALSASPRSGIGTKFSVADWKIRDWQMTTDVEVPGPEGAQDAAIAMVLEAERLRGYYWIKVIAPLILIVAMSWAVNWIDPKDTGTKISIAITAMLTLIAYRFAIGANLPQISYLTRMDLFILFSTILIYASLVMVVTTAAFSSKDRPEVSGRIDRVARWGLPLAFIASWVISMMMPN